MATTELGTPASHASLLARRAAVKASKRGAVIALAVFAGLLVADRAAVGPFADTTFTGTAVGLVAAAVLAVVAGVRIARAGAGDYHRARVGIRSERRVAAALRRCNPAAVVHGAVIDGHGGDADHIVLGGVCAMVETKTGRGRIELTDDGRVRAGGRWLPKRPLQQASNQAAKVTRALGVPCTPIVCVVDATGGPTTRNGVVVCNLKQLPQVLASLPQQISAEQAVAHARMLHQRSVSFEQQAA